MKELNDALREEQRVFEERVSDLQSDLSSRDDTLGELERRLKQTDDAKVHFRSPFTRVAPFCLVRL